MAYLPELHSCAWCGIDLGFDDGDGTCANCEDKLVECNECNELKMPDQECAVCQDYESYFVNGI